MGEEHDANYIINAKSKSEIEIHKFLFGEFSTTYKLKEKSKKLVCNCIGCRCRHHCKHTKWVKAMQNNQPLPEHVTIAEDVTKEEMQKVVNIS